MRISIITVVLNNEATISETIESVLSQKGIDLEYIVVDGNSCDNTINIIGSYISGISKFISETDGGIYEAINKGIMYATGDIIGLLNSDDTYFHDEVLKEVVDHFESDESLNLLYGNLVYVQKLNNRRIVRKWISKSYYPKFFERGNVPPHPTLFVKSEVYRKVGLFNLKFQLASDYEFMLRLFKYSDFKSKYIDKMLVRMRLGGVTNKNIKNIIRGNAEVITAWRYNNLNIPFYFFPAKIVNRIHQFFTWRQFR